MEAFAYLGGSVLNAIPTGIGSAFATELKVVGKLIKCESLGLERYVLEVLNERFGVKREGCVTIKSPVEGGSGLKTSSAVMNVITIILSELNGLRLSPLEVLRVSVEAAKRAGITVTGAFDDASASLLGGLVITDNKKMEIIRREKIERWVVLLPRKREIGLSEVKERLSPFEALFEVAKEEALKGNYERAMLINGLAVANALGYSVEPIRDALRVGAIAAVSGNGPSYVALTDDPDKLLRAWERYGEPIVVRTINEPAYVA